MIALDFGTALTCNLIGADGAFLGGAIVPGLGLAARALGVGCAQLPEVNLTAVQPFLNYNMADGWYLSSAPTITANWSAPSRQQWTIPIGGGVGKVFKMGKQPVNASLRAYHNIEAPATGADWQLQFQVQLLFPK